MLETLDVLDVTDRARDGVPDTGVLSGEWVHGIALVFAVAWNMAAFAL